MVVGTDIWFFLDDVPGNTYSSVVGGMAWAPGALGFTAVHLSRKGKAPIKSGSLTAVAAVVAVGVSWVAGGGILGLVAGGLLGWFFWGNDRST